MREYSIAAIPADGIGPEVIAAGVQALESLQQRIASHIKMKALHMAQTDFYDLMRKITQTIQKPLGVGAVPTAAQ